MLVVQKLHTLALMFDTDRGSIIAMVQHFYGVIFLKYTFLNSFSFVYSTIRSLVSVRLYFHQRILKKIITVSIKILRSTTDFNIIIIINIMIII